MQARLWLKVPVAEMDTSPFQKNNRVEKMLQLNVPLEKL